MLTRIRYILEMIRFSHTLFALPFALLAALMAFAVTDRTELTAGFLVRTVLGILLCMVAARSAAMAFNRIVDWKLDVQNPRTHKRHIPSGLLTLGSVWVFFVICAAGFVASTMLFFPNRLPLCLAVPVLIFICGYSYSKRFTALAHFWLGGALMLAPVSAWIAVRGEHVLQNPMDLLPAVVLGGAVLLWVAGFDMIYACQDEGFDRRVGLRSIPAKLGVRRALRLAAVCHAAMIGLLAVLPVCFPHFGWIYWAGIAAVALLLAYEHWLVSAEDLTRVNVAFFQVNAIISLGLLAIGAIDLLIHARWLR